MKRTYGYSLEREIVDVLLEENPGISHSEIQDAGGGAVALILTVEEPLRIQLNRLATELRFHSRHGAAQAVAVSVAAASGPAWKVLSLPDLQKLTDEAVDLKSQFKLEAALRPCAR
ncbi:hypothetical protein GPA10_22235 [Streptomyces sp. p1417]|uniref:Uncharacterized protein n=1 Tax=Streptomyces typhae TaxID=2681492 RepID=A0A6L6X122_9ACTN|nr:hypothetical protein [Streptomyces typhae]MVO87407.1 hypothetical protein [Streptomyces typhae]